MTEPRDELDPGLRDRIAAAESRIRVTSLPPDGRSAEPSTGRWLRPALMLATAAAAVVLAVFVIGQLPDRSTGGATPSPSAGEGVSASARNGDFVLTLSSPRSMWSSEDAIEITATLSYHGDEAEVEIGGGGGPVVFSLVQLEGGNAVLGGGQDLPCLRYPLGPDVPLVWPFQKAGAVDDEPPFDLTFFQDPELHLPPGRWEVRAFIEYGVGDCGSERLEVAIQIGVMEAADPPGPSAVATEPPVSSVPPSPHATDRPTTDLAWSVTGTFPGGGTTMVTQIISVDDALVAIGVAYDTQLGHVGPEPPHAALAWNSTDGREWEPIDLGDGFRNADLGTVITLPGGSLLALGDRYGEQAGDELGFPEPAAWTSTDGRTWTPTSYPLPRALGQVVRGARGYLASVDANPETGEPDTIWHSVDGRAWEQVHSLGADQTIHGTGAGPEGFVVSARGPDGRIVVWASGDGRSWFPATSPPTSGTWLDIVPVGPDWLGISSPAGEAWFSDDGLSWSPRGGAPLEEITIEDGVSCREFPHHFAAAGHWLVMGTTLSYGCSEGWFVVHGTAKISLNGTNWVRLPFSEGTPGQTRSGSAVNASATIGGNLILAGEQDGVATFWIGEPR